MRVILDGNEYEAPEERTVLEVARSNAIPIPTLCYHEGLGGYGSCRLCLVEVVKGGPPGLHSSCTLPVSPDLEVLTASERVLRARKLSAELLLARAPEASAVRAVAAQLGVDDTDLEPRNELCVLCGRCARTCAALGIYAIDFAWRGTQRVVTTPFGEPSDVCIGCLACFQVCPTGAIEAKVFADRVEISTWNLELNRVSCVDCGKPYLPRRTWDHLQTKLESHLQNKMPLCPQCRRRRQLRAMRLNG